MSALDPFRSARLVLELRQSGVTDAAVLTAVEKTPRELFVPYEYRELAYDNVEVPIDCGQELTRPVMVGMMVQALKLKPSHRVLEVGAGVGYQATILSKLSGMVYSIDRFKTLVETARTTIRALEISNIDIRQGDGLHGLKSESPFDRIILAGAISAVPDALLGQLAPMGILVAPVEVGETQQVRVYTRDENNVIIHRVLAPSKFLPLISGEAREL